MTNNHSNPLTVNNLQQTSLMPQNVPRQAFPTNNTQNFGNNNQQNQVQPMNINFSSQQQNFMNNPQNPLMAQNISTTQNIGINQVPQQQQQQQQWQQVLGQAIIHRPDQQVQSSLVDQESQPLLIQSPMAFVPSLYQQYAQPQYQQSQYPPSYNIPVGEAPYQQNNIEQPQVYQPSTQYKSTLSQMQEAKKKVRNYSKWLIFMAYVLMFFGVFYVLQYLYMFFTLSQWNKQIVYDSYGIQHIVKVSTGGLFFLIIFKIATWTLIGYTGLKTHHTFKPIAKEIDEQDINLQYAQNQGITEYDQPLMSRNKWFQDYHKKMFKFAAIIYALIFLSCVMGAYIWGKASSRFVEQYYQDQSYQNNQEHNQPRYYIAAQQTLVGGHKGKNDEKPREPKQVQAEIDVQTDINLPPKIEEANISDQESRNKRGPHHEKMKDSQVDEPRENSTIQRKEHHYKKQNHTNDTEFPPSEETFSIQIEDYDNSSITNEADESEIISEVSSTVQLATQEEDQSEPIIIVASLHKHHNEDGSLQMNLHTNHTSSDQAKDIGRAYVNIACLAQFTSSTILFFIVYGSLHFLITKVRKEQCVREKHHQAYVENQGIQLMNQINYQAPQQVQQQPQQYIL
eukprot:403362115